MNSIRLLVIAVPGLTATRSYTLPMRFARAADLEEFVRVVDMLPDFNGEVIVGETIVHFTLVPEPSGSMLVTNLIAAGFLRRRWNRCGRIRTAGETP